jgi:hypothetical protein
VRKIRENEHRREREKEKVRANKRVYEKGDRESEKGDRPLLCRRSSSIDS